MPLGGKYNYSDFEIGVGTSFLFHTFAEARLSNRFQKGYDLPLLFQPPRMSR